MDLVWDGVVEAVRILADRYVPRLALLKQIENDRPMLIRINHRAGTEERFVSDAGDLVLDPDDQDLSDAEPDAVHRDTEPEDEPTEPTLDTESATPDPDDQDQDLSDAEPDADDWFEELMRHNERQERRRRFKRPSRAIMR